VSAGNGEQAPDKATARFVTPIPKRPWLVMVSAAVLLALPLARYIAWAGGREAFGRAQTVPSATNLVLVLFGLYLTRMWVHLFLSNSFMTKFLKAADLTQNLRTITVAPCWLRRPRGGARLGLDLGNSTTTFGWVQLRPVTASFDPTAAFGLAGKVGVGRGVVLVSPSSQQIVVSARPMKAIRADRQLHPLGPTADRLLGWTTAAPLPELLTSGRISVQDWGASEPDEAVTDATRMARQTLASRLRPIALATGVLLAVLWLAPAGTAGIAIAVLVGVGYPTTVLAVVRSCWRPLTTLLERTESLDRRQAFTLASMLMVGGMAQSG